MKYVVKKLINIVIIVVFVCTMTPFVLPAQAATFTSMEDNLTRLQTSTLADHTIKFISPSGVGATASFTITFDADFTMGTFALANIDLATASTCNGSFSDRTLVTGLGFPVSPNWRVNQVGQDLVFTNDNSGVSPGECVMVEIGSNATFGAAGSTQITNPSGAQTATLTIASVGDSGTLGIPIVATGGDQVSVTANVDPVIVFAVTDSTIGFGSLSASGARWATGDTLGNGSETSAHDITASTNATSGYTIYVLGSTLTSGGNTIDAIGGSAVASNPGTEQFGIKASASGGSGGVVAPYASADYAYNATSAQDDIALSSVPSLTTTYSITYIANISSTTQPGSYGTTLTYTATGLF
ncbi:hypothetical protein IPN41_03070 [Candidatus Falkowbacteria bacterium]|nr:MAG: hypothetical protein IPN41_03070 [Candidatus Falkowbacteria bacterium]